MTLVSTDERLFIAFATLRGLRSWINVPTDYITLPLQKLAVAALDNAIDALVLDPGLPTARRLDRIALAKLAGREGQDHPHRDTGTGPCHPRTAC